MSPAIRASYAVLLAVSGAGPAGVAVHELSEVTSLHSRTVYRHLRSLRELGLVDAGSHAGKFVLGPVAAGLAVRAVDQRTFLKRAQEVADEVTENSQEPAHVTVYHHGTAVTVAAASEAVGQTTSTVPIVLGSRRPAHASASGKVFLAFNESARAAYLVRPLEQFTPFTVTDSETFLARCREVRHQGFSTDVQENTLGVSCIAVPVRGPRGHVAASIVISTTNPAMPTDRQEQLLSVLQPAAAEFSLSIGGDQR